VKRILAASLFVLLNLYTVVELPAQSPDCCVEDGLEEAARITAPEECCESVQPSFYVRAEGLFLRRDVHGAVPVATEDALLQGVAIPQIVVLSTSLLDEPFRGGPKLLIGKALGDTPFRVEFSFFTVSDYGDGVSVRDATVNYEGSQGNMFSPFSGFGNPEPIPGFDYNNFVAIHETSDLDSEEINLRHLLPMPTRGLTASWLVGVRHIGIHEEFDYVSQSGVPGPGGSSVALRTRTGNRMWGPQIGGLFDFYAHNCCWVSFEVKGALLGNSARQETGALLSSQGLPPAVSQRRDENDTAFSADFDLTVVYHPTRWLTARFGYQAFWLSGLALACENFNIPADKLLYGPADIRTGGKVLYHGPHAGLEIHW
jgi:hypothetical protein